MQALFLFALLARGISNRDLREQICPYWPSIPVTCARGRMTYDLRCLRLHGLIERISHTNRYRLTEHGLKTAMSYSRLYNPVVRPGMSIPNPTGTHSPNPLHRHFSAMSEATNVFSGHRISAVECLQWLRVDVDSDVMAGGFLRITAPAAQMGLEVGVVRRHHRDDVA
jgi:hypothetical protein